MQPFPCNHRLRQSANFSPFFEHCVCRYSNWTEWTIPVNATSVAVPSYQCPSEMAWPEERWQKVISGYECEDKREERHILCKLWNKQWVIGMYNTSYVVIYATHENYKPYLKLKGAQNLLSTHYIAY